MKRMKALARKTSRAPKPKAVPAGNAEDVAAVASCAVGAPWALAPLARLLDPNLLRTQWRPHLEAI